ncbi:MAG: WecB/TagA/CpsF family glycosyltransferase [Cyanobacteria bacterium P01_H01_bin.121]
MNSSLERIETPRQARVLGLPLHLLHDYLGWLESQVRSRQGVHVVTLNAEMAMQATQTPELAAVIQRAELVVPDGAGVVWYLRLRGKRLRRVPGIELAEALLTRLEASSQSVFFFGGKPGVAEQAVAYWQRRCPDLTIAGIQHGYLQPGDDLEVAETLKALRPSVILVGLGVPRQELWITRYRHVCPNAVWVGVGGSLDIWAGQKSRAPRWLREHNLEWVYRLYKEPWRWRRMLALPHFAWKALTSF